MSRYVVGVVSDTACIGTIRRHAVGADAPRTGQRAAAWSVYYTSTYRSLCGRTVVKEKRFRYDDDMPYTAETTFTCKSCDKAIAAES